MIELFAWYAHQAINDQAVENTPCDSKAQAREHHALQPVSRLHVLVEEDAQHDVLRQTARPISMRMETLNE